MSSLSAPATSDYPLIAKAPKRVAVILADRKLAVPALHYLVLRLNTLQPDIEFEFPPVERLASDPAWFDSNAVWDTERLLNDVPTYITRIDTALAQQAAREALLYDTPTRWVVVSLATLDKGYYEITHENYTALFLGDWEKYMVPPSLVEFVVTLIALAGLTSLLAPTGRRVLHLSTRGCSGDFNATLDDVRYKTLHGFLCYDCRNVVEEALGSAATQRWLFLLDKKWLGGVAEPNTPAAVVAKLGYDLFLTAGLAPTRWQRFVAVLSEDGTKEVLKLIGAMVLALLLFFLGVRK